MIVFSSDALHLVVTSVVWKKVRYLNFVRSIQSHLLYYLLNLTRQDNTWVNITYLVIFLSRPHLDFSIFYIYLVTVWQSLQTRIQVSYFNNPNAIACLLLLTQIITLFLILSEIMKNKYQITNILVFLLTH